MTAPSVSRAALANSISYAVAIAVSFVQAPFLIHQLGDERYGLWSLIGLVTGYYGLLDLGTRTAVGFYIARARSQDRGEEIAQVTATAFWFLVAAAIVVLLIGTGMLFFFPELFRIPETWREQSVIALAIALAATVLTLPLDVFSAIVNGCRRAEIVTWSETVLRVITMIAIFAILPRINRLDVLAAIQLGGKVLVWGVAFSAARRLEPRWSLSPRFAKRSMLREVTTSGLRSFVVNVASLFVERVDSVVIAVALGGRFVTMYVIGQSLVSYVSMGVNSVTLALTPFFADLSSREDSGRTRELFFFGTRAASLMTGVMTGGLVAFATPFIAKWIGPSYVTGELRFRSDVVVFVLLVAQVPRLVLGAAHQFLFGTNQHGFLARVLVFEGIANLALSVMLVHPLGIVGIAVGTALPSLVSHGWFIPRFVSGALGVPVRRIMLEGQARGLLSGVVIAAVGLAIARSTTLDTWPRLFAAIGATLIVASPVMWLVSFNAQDRDYVRRLASKVMPAGRSA